MNRRLVIVACGVLVVLLGSALDVTVGADDVTPVEMNEVLAAWRDRAAAIQRAAYSYSVSVTELDETISTGATFATRKRAFEVHLGKGPNILTRRRGEFLVGLATPGYYEFVMSSAFNGEIGTELYGDGYPDPAEQAFVNSNYACRDEPETLPVILMHRPFEGLLRNYDIRDWQVSGIKFARNGTRAIAIASQHGPYGIQFQLLLDPRRDYVAVEGQMMGRDGRLIEDVSISYGSNAAGILHPQEWRVTHFHGDSGEVLRAMSARVDRVKFDDETPSVSYQVVFKPGTVVQYENLGEIEVIRGDGSNTRFSASVENPGARISEELHLRGTSYSSRIRWVLISTLVAALIMAGAGWRILKSR